MIRNIKMFEDGESWIGHIEGTEIYEEAPTQQELRLLLRHQLWNKHKELWRCPLTSLNS